MSLSAGDFGYPIRAANGARILVPCSLTNTADDFALSARIAGGCRTLVKADIGPHSIDDLVVPARLVGGARTLVNLKTRGPYICNSCDPPLYDQYLVTISGLGGDYSAHNSGYSVLAGEESYCTWHTTTYPSSYPWVRVNVIPAGSIAIMNIQMAFADGATILWQIFPSVSQKCSIEGRVFTPLFTWSSGFPYNGSETATIT